MYSEYPPHPRDGEGALIARVRAEERLAHSEMISGRSVAAELAVGPIPSKSRSALTVFHHTPCRPVRKTPRPRLTVSSTESYRRKYCCTHRCAGTDKVIFPFDMKPGEAGDRPVGSEWPNCPAAASTVLTSPFTSAPKSSSPTSAALLIARESLAPCRTLRARTTFRVGAPPAGPPRPVRASSSTSRATPELRGGSRARSSATARGGESLSVFVCRRAAFLGRGRTRMLRLAYGRAGSAPAMR